MRVLGSLERVVEVVTRRCHQVYGVTSSRAVQEFVAKASATAWHVHPKKLIKIVLAAVWGFETDNLQIMYPKP